MSELDMLDILDISDLEILDIGCVIQTFTLVRLGHIGHSRLIRHRHSGYIRHNSAYSMTLEVKPLKALSLDT